MRTVWITMLAVSSGSLLWMLIRRKLRLEWLARFGTHLVLSALAIYALNFSGWAAGLHVPLNPVTIGTVAVLGLPGIGLILGLQHVLLV